MFNVGVLTVSDKGSRHEREDLSGEAIQNKLSPLSVTIAKQDIVPDEKKIIAQRLSDWFPQRLVWWLFRLLFLRCPP